MAPIGEEEEPVESLYQLLASALSIGQALTLGSAYFSLDRILVEGLVKSAQFLVEAKLMPVESSVLSEPRRVCFRQRNRSDLDIPVDVLSCLLP